MSSLLKFRVKQTALPQNYSSIKMHGLHVSTCSLKRCGFSNMCTKIMWAGEGERNPFFYTTQKQVLQIVPILNQS